MPLHYYDSFCVPYYSHSHYHFRRLCLPHKRVLASAELSMSGAWLCTLLSSEWALKRGELCCSFVSECSTCNKSEGPISGAYLLGQRGDEWVCECVGVNKSEWEGKMGGSVI